MSLSFKEFSAVYDTPGTELSEEQIQEIFGIFASKEKVDAAKALKAKQEFQDRKDAKAKKAEIYNKQQEIDAKEREQFVKKPQTAGALALATKPLNQLRAGQLRALDRNPFGESVKK